MRLKKLIPPMSIVLLVLTLAMPVGCARREPPAATADDTKKPAATAKSPGPFLYVAAVPMIPGQCSSRLHDLGSAKAPASMSWAGGGSEILWDGWVVKAGKRDRPISGAYRLPFVICDARRVDGATWEASATYDDTKGRSGRKCERKATFKAEKGAAVVLLLPSDEKPEYAAVFCVLPEEKSREPGAANKKNGVRLLEVGFDLRDQPKPLLGPALTDLGEYPYGNGGYCMFTSGGPPSAGEVTWASMDAPPIEGRDALAVSAEVTVCGQPDEQLEGKKDLPIRKGETEVILLRDETDPRFLFVFSILPEVGKE